MENEVECVGQNLPQDQPCCVAAGGGGDLKMLVYLSGASGRPLKLRRHRIQTSTAEKEAY